MLKNILNVNGAQELSKDAQKTVKGGGPIVPIGLGEGVCPTNPNLCITGAGICVPCHK